MQDTPKARAVEWKQFTSVIQIKDYVLNSKVVTEYDRRYLKKAREYWGQNIVSIANKMRKIVSNVYRIIVLQQLEYLL